MLQRGGAFKFRGAYNVLVAARSRSARAGRRRAVVGKSRAGRRARRATLRRAGHGRHADDRDAGAKRDGAERLGARVELAGTTTADRMARAEEMMREEGWRSCRPTTIATIIAGQGTVGLEIAARPAGRREPCSCRWAAADSAPASRRRSSCARPNARVIGVEPAGAPKLSRARAAGEPVKLEHTRRPRRRAARGARSARVTFAHHHAYLDDVVTVDDDALARAMRLLLDRMKLVVEPSGAITVAALLERARRAARTDRRRVERRQHRVGRAS